MILYVNGDSHSQGMGVHLHESYPVIVAKEFGIPLLVNVTVSDPGVVVIVMPVPAANVKISVAESATTSD